MWEIEDWAQVTPRWYSRKAACSREPRTASLFCGKVLLGYLLGYRNGQEQPTHPYYHFWLSTESASPSAPCRWPILNASTLGLRLRHTQQWRQWCCDVLLARDSRKAKQWWSYLLFTRLSLQALTRCDDSPLVFGWMRGAKQKYLWYLFTLVAIGKFKAYSSHFSSPMPLFLAETG